MLYAKLHSLYVLLLIKLKDIYIRKYDRSKYVALFHFNENHNRIFDRIRYLIVLKKTIFQIFP